MLTMMPERMIASVVLPLRQTFTPITYVIATAHSPPRNVIVWMKTAGAPHRIATAAPSAAPADTPRIDGETIGLRNMT